MSVAVRAWLELDEQEECVHEKEDTCGCNVHSDAYEYKWFGICCSEYGQYITRQWDNQDFVRKRPEENS